ncbi:hypothetical protein [Cohnella boryungensis]|uniref:Uncharacterized protein n=1 Tax=Cohnella boryungensis TaxID=768479 RepID=A0ABV8SGP8_9BACL
MTRSDRLSHPAVFVYDAGKVYGLNASPYFVVINGYKRPWKPGQEGEFFQYGGFTCTLSRGAIGYTLGYEHSPWQFIKSKLVKDRSPLGENCFELQPHEAVEFTIESYEYEGSMERDIHAAIQEVYYRYRQEPRIVSDPITAVSDLARAVARDAWLPEELAYSGQVFEHKGSGGYRYNPILSLSWTNGLSVATPMLMAALRLGDESMRQQALSFIANTVEHSLNPASGLPYDACPDGKWGIQGWWFDGMRTPGHSSYLVGQALYYILKAYEYEKRIKDIVHEDWLDFVRDAIPRIERTKNTDHEYPYIFSEKTGAGLEYDSFSGTWCLAATAYYSWLTGDGKYLEGLRLSEQHYYDAYVRHVECYGAPLDTDKAVDSEGILAYIKAVKYLHAITGKKTYLEHMRDAICYEFSFKFGYNSPIKAPPLSRIGWSSCGGSVTSTANPHIHPMGSNLVDELLYYLDNCEDDYIRDRLEDTVRWGCQTYNTYDKEYGYGKKGWMSERFCHSDGLLTQTYDDGTIASTWFCLMPWASSCIIEGLSGEYWEKKVPY